VKTVVIHCSDSPQGRGDNAKTIHLWHKERGFDGIGYHYVILEDGTVQNGRPEYWEGAHVKGHNKDTIGICLIGKNKFTFAQLQACRNMIREKFQESQIKGHYEFDSRKTCPNINMDKFRAFVIGDGAISI